MSQKISQFVVLAGLLFMSFQAFSDLDSFREKTHQAGVTEEELKAYLETQVEQANSTIDLRETHVMSPSALEVYLALQGKVISREALQAYIEQKPKVISREALETYIEQKPKVISREALETYIEQEPKVISREALEVYLALQGKVISEEALQAYMELFLEERDASARLEDEFRKALE